MHFISERVGLNNLHASSLNKTSLCRITSQKQNEILGSEKQIVTPLWDFQFVRLHSGLFIQIHIKRNITTGS